MMGVLCPLARLPELVELNIAVFHDERANQLRLDEVARIVFPKLTRL